MADITKRLPDAELEVMQALWSLGGDAARAEIEEVLRAGHPMAPTTVLTLLGRLGEKGFVKSEKVGKAARYSAEVKKEDYLAAQSKSFLHKVFGGSVPAFAAALCSGGLSEEEIKLLRDLLKGEGK